MAKTNATVLYIADTWQVLPEDAKRKGRSTPLAWGKLRTGADCSETGLLYQMRRQAIKAGREGFAYLGVYDELLAAYGFGRTAPLRGWLVNHKYQAATIGQIGQVIGMGDLKLLRRALRALEVAGLLVRLERPDMEAATCRIGDRGQGRADGDPIRPRIRRRGSPAMEGSAMPHRQEVARQRPAQRHDRVRGWSARRLPRPLRAKTEACSR